MICNTDFLITTPYLKEMEASEEEPRTSRTAYGFAKFQSCVRIHFCFLIVTKALNSFLS